MYVLYIAININNKESYLAKIINKIVLKENIKKKKTGS